MKFRKLGRVATATVLSLGFAAGITACSGPNGFNNTVDYVYVSNSKSGQIDVYYLDKNSGGLTQIPDSPYPSGGSNPVALVTSPNFKTLYVANNGEGGSAGSGIVQFAIGTDAKLYPQHTTQGPAGSSLSVPNGVAINSAGTFLFVTYNYILGGSSSASPSAGALVVYPIAADGSLGTPVPNGTLPYYPLSSGTDILNPTAIDTVNSGSTFVYVVSQNGSSGVGEISAFSVGTGGALTAVLCSAATSVCDAKGNGTFRAGIAPSAIAGTPLGRYLYVTDSARDQLLSYAVQADGQIVASAGNPASTDVGPDAVTVDPSGTYVYVANYTANDINAYAIDPSSSTGGVASVGSYSTGTGPTCVFVEPALGSYLYTTNFLDNTVSGLKIDLTGGTLAAVQNNPFLAAGQPTCIAATVHGKHPTIAPAN